MNEQRYDIVTVGGGVAGAATAAVMARAGARVLILERELAFRDRVRGEWLAPWGVGEARALRLMEAFQKAGAHELPALAGRSLKARPVTSPEGDVPITFAHHALQEALVQAATAAGAEVVRGARVTEVTNGSRGKVQFKVDGAEFVVTGRIVVGADGRSSLVRRALGRTAQVHRDSRVLAGVRVGGVSGDPGLGYFIVRDDAGGLVSLFPQGAGFARGYVFVQGSDASTFAGPDGFKRFVKLSIAMGVPANAFASAYPAGPLAAFVTDDSWIEHPAERSLVLVGDAAGVSDPTWGMGLALALRDVRNLTEKLRANADWNLALHAYADERDGYFRTIVTAENWQSDLQLSTGREADRRRRHAMRLWSKEPGRALDLPGIGPGLDTSEEARVRFYGEDVPFEVTEGGGRPRATATNDAVAQACLDALKGRDFDALGAFLATTIRMRALLPGGPVEIHGASDVVSAFVGWFRDVEDFEVLHADYDEVADRMQLRWQFSLRWPDEAFTRVIEQRAYAKVIDGRIAVLDVLCSGFRPVGSAA